MSHKVRFALVQYPVQSDFLANKKKVFQFLDRAVGRHPRYIVLPEMWLGAPRDKGERGYWNSLYQKALKEAQIWAQKNRTGLFFSQLEKSGGLFFNTAYYIGTDGKMRGRYRKIHLFSLGRETEIYSPGSQLGIFETPLGKIGLVICYDIRFPELIRQLAVKGARLLIVPAQWPSVRDEHWTTLLSARAIENQIFVIGVNRTGWKQKMKFSGNSLVFDPWGRKILQISSSKSVGICDLDLNQVARTRKKYPFFRERKLV